VTDKPQIKAAIPRAPANVNKSRLLTYIFYASKYGTYMSTNQIAQNLEYPSINHTQYIGMLKIANDVTLPCLNTAAIPKRL